MPAPEIASNLELKWKVSFATWVVATLASAIALTLNGRPSIVFPVLLCAIPLVFAVFRKAADLRIGKFLILRVAPGVAVPDVDERQGSVSLSAILRRFLRLFGFYSLLSLGGSAGLVASKAPPDPRSIALFIPVMVLLVYTLLSVVPIDKLSFRGDLKSRFISAIGIAIASLLGWMLVQEALVSDRQKVPVVTAEDLTKALALERRRPYFAAQRRFLNELPFGDTIGLAAERHDVDPLLVAAVVEAESKFNPDAVSPRGAIGLMLVAPEVGKAYGAKELRDPETNLDVGSRYLRSLLREYDGDVELAVAAYNAGPEAVARYGGVPPYPETRETLRRVLAQYEEYRRSVRIKGEASLGEKPSGS